MTEDQIEELLVTIQEAANFLCGASFDKRIPSDTREAMAKKAEVLTTVVEQYT